MTKTQHANPTPDYTQTVHMTRSNTRSTIKIADKDISLQQLTIIYHVATANQTQAKLYITLSKRHADIQIFVAPIMDNFHFTLHVTAVLTDTAQLTLKTDTIPQKLHAQTLQIRFKGHGDPVYSYIKQKNTGVPLVSTGFVNIQKRILVFDKAKVTAVPEFRVLPGSINALHGLVIYNLSPKEKFYLQSRGVMDVKRVVGKC